MPHCVLRNAKSRRKPQESVMPGLLRDPLNKVDAVFALVHVSIPGLWLALAGAAHVLGDHNVAALGERNGHLRELSAIVGSAHGDRRRR